MKGVPMLPDKAVHEFRETYNRVLKVEITFDEAKVKAENFIQLFELISSSHINNTPRDESYEKR